MSLSAFIRDHHEEIISEFAVFARTLMPPGVEMTDAELRDHAEELLTAAVEDMTLRRPATNSLTNRRVAGLPRRCRRLGSFTRMIAFSTASRFGPCSQSFARFGRRCCGSRKQRGIRPH